MPNLKNALLNWLNNSIAQLSTRTPYAKGYREGITQAKTIVENIINDAEPTDFYNEDGHGFCASIEKHSIIEKNYQICSYCGKRFNEGYFLGNEYACSHECAVGLYKGDEKQLNADLEQEELEPGTTECYWTIWD